jgi:hypothetical protein
MKKSLLLLFMLAFALLSYATVAETPDDNITKSIAHTADAVALEVDKAIAANEDISDQLVMNAAAESRTPEVIFDQATPGPDDPPTVKSYSEWYMLIYGALILLFGEIGKIFGWKNAVPKYKYVFVVIAFGVVAGAGFLWHGMSFLMVFLTLASTLGIYDVLAGLFKKKTEHAT